MSNDATFSKAYQELEQLTAEFEKGDLDLEKAIPKFKRAAELAKFLKTKLNQLETQIEEINTEINNEAEGKIEKSGASSDIEF